MIRKLTIILTILSLFSIQSVFATVDYLVVNHLTKQLYWAETDHPPGLIGWEGVGEVHKTKEQKYLDSGYLYTNNPYLIEEGIILVIIALILTYRIVRNRKKKNALQQKL